jgi:short-subunit dehydrogenase
MNIVITGAARGIGFEVTKLLSENKEHKIVAISRNEEVLNELSYLSVNQNIIPIVFSLENLIDNPQYLYKKIISAFTHVDVLINNAGVIVNKPFSETSEAEVLQMLLVNYIAPSELIRILIPIMGIHGRAHVLNISSMGGVMGSVKYSGLSHYSASKAAIACLSECLAAEFKHLNISFNSLALGAVQTEMFEEAFPGYKAPISAADMAQFIAQFAVEGQKYFNGKILPVSNSNP